LYRVAEYGRFVLFFLRCKANARVKPAEMGTARTVPNFCVVLYIVCFVSFRVLCVCVCVCVCVNVCVCKCVLYCCHRVATQLQLTNISYHCEERERENQQDATIRCLLSTLSQHVSGIIMPIFRRTKTVCYCMWCAALVLLDVVGSGCGALRCGV